jgi:hypothetical protein
MNKLIASRQCQQLILARSNEQLRCARENLLLDLDNEMSVLDKRETLFDERMLELDHKKDTIVCCNSLYTLFSK